MGAAQIRRVMVMGALTLTLAGCGTTVSGLAVGDPITPLSTSQPDLVSTSRSTSVGPSAAASARSGGTVSPPRGPRTPSVEATGASSLTTAEFLAKLVGGDPASNLLWVLPGVPSGWTAIAAAGSGVHAWQLPNSRCRVILQQPDGMSAGSVSSSAALAADASDRLATTNRSTSPQVVATTPVTFTVADVPGQVSVEFAGQQTHFADLGVTSMVWAYLSGDYALLAENVCPDADMATWKASAGPFYRDLTVRIEF